MRRSTDIYTRSIQNAYYWALGTDHIFRSRDLYDRIFREVGFREPPVLPKKQQTKSYERQIAEAKRVKRSVLQEVQHALRGAKDRDGVRIFVCQRIAGQQAGNWVRLDICKADMLRAIDGNRRDLARAVRPLYIQLALNILDTMGPEATFGDVRGEVLSQLRPTSLAS